MNVKKILTTLVFILCALIYRAQSVSDTLTINYFAHAPFSYSENSEVQGIEPDIIREYVSWLRVKKKIYLRVKYMEYGDFSDFYFETKVGNPKNTIGMGSAVINQERIKEVDFTTGYAKNVAFCVTNGYAANIKTKTPEEIMKVLGSMTALTITNTSMSKCVNDIKKNYVKDLKISYLSDETQILNRIAASPLNFGFIDAVVFWSYVKDNPTKSVKTQKVLNQNEEMGFVLPKGSKHKLLFNEFFTTFKTSPEYREILEKHLGTYMAQNVMLQ